MDVRQRKRNIINQMAIAEKRTRESAHSKRYLKIRGLQASLS